MGAVEDAARAHGMLISKVLQPAGGVRHQLRARSLQLCHLDGVDQGVPGQLRVDRQISSCFWPTLPMIASPLTLLARRALSDRSRPRASRGDIPPP